MEIITIGMFQFHPLVVQHQYQIYRCLRVYGHHENLCHLVRGYVSLWHVLQWQISKLLGDKIGTTFISFSRVVLWKEGSPAFGF